MLVTCSSIYRFFSTCRKRFDDIFDSTKYSKALKVFRDTEKEFISRTKDLKADLAGLAAHRTAAEGFRKERTEQKEALESVDEMKKEISQKIAKIDARMQEVTAILDQCYDTDNLINEHKKRLEQHKLLIAKQREVLEKDLTGDHSLTDLKEMLSNFRSKMSEQERALEELVGEHKRLGDEIEDGRKREKGLTSNLGKLQAEKEAHEKRLRERYNKMEHIAQKYNMDLTQMTQSQTQNSSFIAAALSQSMVGGDEDEETLITISAEDMQGFFQEVEAKETDLRASLKELKERNRAAEDEITAALTELGGKQRAIENGMFPCKTLLAAAASYSFTYTSCFALLFCD